jgi:transglutaminase-like putative cysteine protease
MSFAHARRFLFTLYASSKRGRPRSAGRFGIGFWSVLRFSPETILVRSRPSGGEAWQVRLDGDLEHLVREPAVMDPGTEVVLERRSRGRHPDADVRSAVLRDAPFLRCRDYGGRPLEVIVNGESVTADAELPPPSLSFRRRGLSGVVALGLHPRVEIFAHGLRVRDAATLDELLLESHGSRPVIPATPDGLAPQVIIDSRELSVLMARGDVREDRALQRLVAVGHRELKRLVRAELDCHARLSLPARLAERVGEAWSASWIPKITAIGIVMMTVLGGASLALRPWFNGRGKVVAAASEPGLLELPQPDNVAYRDLKSRYGGPGADALRGHERAVELRYRPVGQHLYFAALLVTGLDEAGIPVEDAENRTQPYAGAPCIDGCVEVEIEIDAYGGLLRLPIAAGHVIDPDSVFLDGQQLNVEKTVAGEPVVRLERRRTGLLRYLSAPGIEGEIDIQTDWPALPPEVQGLALALDELPVDARSQTAAGFVRRNVIYDRSSEIVERHREAASAGESLFQRTMDIGAGDCDIQNAMVVAMLNRAGVRARLAIGWVGVDGRALPGLHAWAEYLDEGGRWRVVDASTEVETAAVEIVEQKPQVTAGSLRNGDVGGWWWLGAAVLVPFLAAAFAFFVGRRAWRRSFRPGGKSDLAGLLSGAALRPTAFARIHPLFARRVVPLITGRSISLAKAQEMMAKGRLAWGREESKLANRSARAGCAVLDGSSSAGLAVAKALGALDLDRWQRILDRSRAEEVTDRVEEALVGGGEPCHVRVAAEVGEEIAVLDGAPLGLGRRDRWVVVDEASDLWRAVGGIADERLAAAALILGDAIVPRVGATAFGGGRCLAELAAAAIRDQAGGRV